MDNEKFNKHYYYMLKKSCFGFPGIDMCFHGEDTQELWLSDWILQVIQRDDEDKKKIVLGKHKCVLIAESCNTNIMTIN